MVTSEAEAAAAAIAELTGVAEHRAAVVLGSGWQRGAELLGTPRAVVPMAKIPGFRTPTAEGHRGSIVSIDVGGTAVLLLMGRNHLYEGYTPDEVSFPLKAAHAAGARTVVLTNAAGGISTRLKVGDVALIGDHLNLTARTPLTGATFVDLVDCYDPQLRKVAQTIDASLTEGVYAGLLGPQYETPAEIRMLRTLGADLVGMSTVLETIAARALGMRVLGLSLVTNMAAGVTGAHLDHAEVLAEGQAAAPRLGALLRGVLEQL